MRKSFNVSALSTTTATNTTTHDTYKNSPIAVSIYYIVEEVNRLQITTSAVEYSMNFIIN